MKSQVKSYFCAWIFQELVTCTKRFLECEIKIQLYFLVIRSFIIVVVSI